MIGRRAIYVVTSLFLWAHGAQGSAKDELGTGIDAEADAPPALHEVALEVGDVHELNAPADHDLQVSRRGIVDIQHLGAARWRLIALRSGLVIIASHRSEGKSTLSQPAAEPRWLVRVRPSAERREDGESKGASSRPLPTWLCQAPGISCHESLARITGTAPSSFWLQRARAYCRQHACFVDARLSGAMQSALAQSVQEFLPAGAQVSASEAGKLNVATFCQGETAQDWRQKILVHLDQEITTQDLIVACLEKSSREIYRLEARILRLGDSDARALGLAPNWRLEWSDAQSINSSLLARLHSSVHELRAAIVGSPILRLSPNKRTEAVSGGELQVPVHDADDDRAQSVWKQFGMRLSVTAQPLSATDVRLIYAMSLRTPQGLGATASLSVHELAGETDLKISEPSLIGIIDVSSADADERGDILLSKIPIVGPLFRMNAAASSRSRLLVWFALSREETPPASWPEPPPPPPLPPLPPSQ